MASALITGCTIIIKPSPFTPYSTLKCIEIAQEFFPAGVVQVLGGDDKLGPMLTAHPGIDRIAFTGSIATGKKIMEACAKTLKRVTLELGGNDVSIVLPDVNIQQVAPEVVLGALQNSGQVCIATKRVFIHQDIYRPFVDAMVAFTKYLKPGSPEDPSTGLGPVQNKMQYDRVMGFVDDCREKGYTFATGEQTVKQGKGYFVQPTIIDNPPTESRIVQEEPFGMVFPSLPCTSLPLLLLSYHLRQHLTNHHHTSQAQSSPCSPSPPTPKPSSAQTPQTAVSAPLSGAKTLSAPSALADRSRRVLSGSTAGESLIREDSWAGLRNREWEGSTRSRG